MLILSRHLITVHLLILASVIAQSAEPPVVEESPSREEMTTHVFRIRPDFREQLAKALGIREIPHSAVLPILEAGGISFPDGSKVLLHPSPPTLCFRSTEPQIVNLRKLLKRHQIDLRELPPPPIERPEPASAPPQP